MQLEVLTGDITQITADAIVNAANTSLLGGGGVDDAIHRVGGRAILDECKAIKLRQGGCPVGEAVITTAGRLPANKVIHTVGPTWIDGNCGESERLTACYLSCLSIAEKERLKVVAFPNISTGVYRFPKDKAAKIAWQTVTAWTGHYPEKVLFVCFEKANYLLYQALYQTLSSVD
ncbi:MAG: O-acetyl-ADP-ribose deacetylase [Gammaproteobacteria bacterium]|nr:MAG: O-acetyl-ADP-ribose deacetylase [Gammaproteobacteria bacterium]